VLDSQALARLVRRHPESTQRIRKVAEARALADQASLGVASRPRKPRSASTRSKHDEPETL
jgi:hypothetical protein